MAPFFELHHEVKRGNTVRVRELLRNGGEVNATDRAGYTPLMHALENPATSVELLQLLLDSGGVVREDSLINGTHYNSVALCLRSGDPLKLATLIERGADLHYTRAAGYDALMDAAFSCNSAWGARLLDVLRMLIAHGVPLSSVSSYQESALRVLSRLGRFDAVRLLLDAGGDEAQLAWTPLHHAVAFGTLNDVKALVEGGAHLEATDWWERTPWLVAVKMGSLEKARYLIDSGASAVATGRGGESPLVLAIESFQTPMLKWLIELGISVESSADCCTTPLMAAVQAGNIEAVDALIEAGADVDRQTRCGNALGCVQTREIALRLLAAGANPGDLSFEGRRAILGFEPEPDESLFDATHEEYGAAPTACWGDANPELMNQPFWQAMIRSGISAYAGAQLVGETHDDYPVWCAQRFGQSLTLLPDGRAIQIGGEHEDFYDSDFCIYNDVFVHHADGRIDIYCYPEDVFPPTDFHTATLVGNSIFIIGGLRYGGTRRFGETSVFRLDTITLQIHRIETTGDAPGWISKHRGFLFGSNQIRVWAGKISTKDGDTESLDDNHGSWTFDVTHSQWGRDQCNDPDTSGHAMQAP